MPFFTYVFSYAGQTASRQLRKSNPQGWLFQVVGEAFPALAKAHGNELIRLRLEPVPGQERTWRASVGLAGSAFVAQVTETRDSPAPCATSSP